MPTLLPRVLVLASLLLAVAQAVAETPDGSDRERELDRIRSEISRLQERLQSLQRERRGLAGELARTEAALELQRARVAEARAARDVAGARLAATESAVAELEAQLAAVKADLQGRLSALFRLGQLGYLRLFLSLDRGQDVLGAVRVLRFLARRDAETRRRYEETRGELTAERAELLERRKEVEAWVVREEARRAELGRLESRQRALLAEVERQRQRLARRAEDLEERERRLASLIDFLSGRRGALEGEPIQGFRGVLDWPARGRVKIGFGPRRDPRYGTRVPHNGILLETRPGSEVRAIYPGRVLFAASFDGYGPTAVVQHPERVFTLYAGLASLVVRQDDILALGEAVGTAAEDLYFEVRLRNRPEDPLAWLR